MRKASGTGEGRSREARFSSRVSDEAGRTALAAQSFMV